MPSRVTNTGMEGRALKIKRMVTAVAVGGALTLGAAMTTAQGANADHTDIPSASTSLKAQSFAGGEGNGH
jgi:hypothetical protein